MMWFVMGQITNSKGQVLQCSHYVPMAIPEDMKLPCVIYCHGNRLVTYVLAITTFECFHISLSSVIVVNVVTFELVFQSLNELMTYSCELFYVNLSDTLILGYLSFMLITIGLIFLPLIHGSMTRLGFHLYHFMDCKYKGIKREMTIILPQLGSIYVLHMWMVIVSTTWLITLIYLSRIGTCCIF